MPQSQRPAIRDTFDGPEIDARWRPRTMGAARLVLGEGVLRCEVGPAGGGDYHDAQITDYEGLPARDYPHRPPLRLTVRAWTSAPDRLRGTAGFGFWNQPYVPQRLQRPRLPRAVWFFFGSPPNDMALAKGVPGWGWKAATLDTGRLAFLLLAPFAPLGFLLMRAPVLYRRLWPVGQRAIGVSEKRLEADLAAPHTYQLDWLRDRVIFRVDGSEVHVAPHSPGGPLGFVAWVDNQYAVVTPQGRFGHGLLPLDEPQWLALDQVFIEPLQEVS